MTTREVRSLYLEFFGARGHKIIPSALIVPRDDPTTLFTSSGMQPLVPYLLGKPHPEGKRLANSQKCLRTNDIEEVGDNRHTTFFEMLGNWSLGDYFKKEQLGWVFEFIVSKLKLDPQKLRVSVFTGNESVPKDNDSIAIWKEIFKNVGINAKEDQTIFAYPAKKNWWSRSGEPEKMPAGEPGGPDSELFYDFGEELRLHENSPYKDTRCHPNCDCGRFMEIGNSVFMQYQKQADGSLKEMAQKNVDFGGGLERMTAATLDNPDVFQIDTLKPLIEKIEQASGFKYGSIPSVTRFMRIIADHIRAVVFITSEGVLPSNVGQGYILRRLIRRAMRQSKLLNIEDGFLPQLAQEVIVLYKDAYSELSGAEEFILRAIRDEELKFSKTMVEGLAELDKTIKWWDTVSGAEKVGADGTVKPRQFGEIENQLGDKLFDLYQSHGLPLELSLEEMEKIYNVNGALMKEGAEKQFNFRLKQHQELSRAGAEKKFGGVGENATEKMANLHTATHLLHQALRRVLGEHVRQMGSDIAPDRLRFDFSHPVKLTPEEISRVEELVNEEIKKDQTVTREEMPYNEAIKIGALAFFREKYPERVTVYSAGIFSKEICAGPHASHTGALGKFKIDKEESSSAGVRRIKASLSND